MQNIYIYIYFFFFLDSTLLPFVIHYLHYKEFFYYYQKTVTKIESYVVFFSIVTLAIIVGDALTLLYSNSIHRKEKKFPINFNFLGKNVLRLLIIFYCKGYIYR
jgi:hypothetical protein